MIVSFSQLFWRSDCRYAVVCFDFDSALCIVSKFVIRMIRRVSLTLYSKGSCDSCGFADCGYFDVDWKEKRVAIANNIVIISHVFAQQLIIRYIANITFQFMQPSDTLQFIHPIHRPVSPSSSSIRDIARTTFQTFQFIQPSDTLQRTCTMDIMHA